MNIKVDILLPVFNGARYLEAQVDSILNQTHKNISLLIYDDYSEDNSVSLIMRLANQDKRITFLQFAVKNIGLVNSVELLMKNSTADYLMFADQDDVWMKDKVELFLQKMHVFQGDSPCLVHSDSYITDEYLNVRKRFFGGNFVGIGLKSSFFNYQVQGSSTMINHYLKELVLPFPDYVYLHDRYLNLMVDLFGTRIYIDTPTMYYRQHRNNLIGSQTYFRKLLRNLNIFKQVFYFEKDKLLFKGIRQDKLPDHKLLNLYAYLTDNSVNRWRKLYLIFKENIPIRLKELFLLLINN